MPLYRDRNWLYEHYVDRKMTSQEIADSVGVSKSTILRWLNKYDFKIKTKFDISKDSNPMLVYLEDKNWLYQKYIIETLSINKISKMLDSCQHTVLLWIEKHGIPKRNLRESRMLDNPNVDLINDGKTIPKLYAKGLSITEIADHLQCSTTPVVARLDEQEIKMRGSSCVALLKNPLLNKLRDKKWLKKQYIENNYPTTIIAKKLNTSKETVAFWLKKHRIKIKDIKSRRIYEKTYTDQDMENRLKALFKILGHIPTYEDIQEYSRKNFCPSPGTYRSRGGIKYWQRKVFGESNKAWNIWQKECISVFNKVLDYPKFKAEKSFDWLRSPITGHRLKVDVYYPTLKLCVEFDGIGHFEPVQFLKGQDADKQFKKTQIHDAEKNKKIPEHGLTLIRFKYDEPLTKEYVRELLEDVLEKRIA